MSAELTTHQQSRRAPATNVSPWREAVNDEVGASFGAFLKFTKGDWVLGGGSEKECPREHASWRTSMSTTEAGSDGGDGKPTDHLSVELWIATKFPPVRSWAS